MRINSEIDFKKAGENAEKRINGQKKGYA